MAPTCPPVNPSVAIRKPPNEMSHAPQTKNWVKFRTISLFFMLIGGPQCVIGQPSRDGKRLEAPDVLRVLPDRAVARELADAGRVENRLPRPAFAVAERGVDPRLAVAVRAEVREDH